MGQYGVMQAIGTLLCIVLRSGFFHEQHSLESMGVSCGIPIVRAKLRMMKCN